MWRFLIINSCSTMHILHTFSQFERRLNYANTFAYYAFISYYKINKIWSVSHIKFINNTISPVEYLNDKIQYDFPSHIKLYFHQLYACPYFVKIDIIQNEHSIEAFDKKSRLLTFAMAKIISFITWNVAY